MTPLRFVAPLLLLGFLAAACGDTAAPSETTDADTVLGLTYATFDGGTEQFADRVGTPLVVNFFAQWCANCVHEMPDFEQVAGELAGEVEFVGISIDKGSDDALRLVEATGVTYDVGWDPSETLYAHFRALAMPTTVFIDETGRIARVWSGVLSADALRATINEEIL